MKYPGIGAYTDAMASIDMTVLDSVLSGGDVENNSWGMPLARSGSFAYTFKINTRSGDYAFRLFQTERKGMQTRYKAISDELAAHPNKFFVDFEYLTQGIRVEGDAFPAIRMRWADGEPLGVYIEKNLKNAQRLRVLQKNIGKLASSMENAGIAHGDIQMGNVLVQSTGAVMLVDYDGMFVPGLANMNSVEVGHPNFQHPERSQIQPFDATLDRFSFALIHTGLEALIEKPDLWTTFHADSDALLFRGKDLAEPGASPLFTQLNALPVTGVFSQRLASLANASYSETPTVNDFLSGTNIPAGVARKKQSRSTGSTTPKSASNIPWYQEQRVNDSSSAQNDSEIEDYASSLVNDAPWVIDARNSEQVFDYAGERVMLVARINQVNTTVGTTTQPAVELTLSADDDDDQRIYVTVTTGGLENFAQEGTTIDRSWKSSWVLVTGTLKVSLRRQPQLASIDVTDTENLIRTDYNEARKVIAGKETQHTFGAFYAPQPSSTQAQHQSPSNDDLVANLSGSGSKVSQKTASQSGSSTINTQSTLSPGTSGLSKDRWGNPIWVWLLGFVLFIVVAIAIIVAVTVRDLSSSNSSSDSNTSSESTTSTRFDSFVSQYEGTCVQKSGASSACNIGRPMFRVVDIGPSGYTCSAGQVRKIKVGRGVLCLERIERKTPLEVVESVGDTGFEPVEPVALETCTEIEYSGEQYTECFPGERWEYVDCWNDGGAVLEQKKKGTWVTVKQNISTKDGCTDGFPWTVEFTRKASGVGVKQYRLYFPAQDGYSVTIENIKVTVREA